MLSLTDPTPDQYGQTEQVALIFRFPTDVVCVYDVNLQ